MRRPCLLCVCVCVCVCACVCAAASKVSALERHEPFATTREMHKQRTALESRQRDRAWSQEIVFLPPRVAARERSLVRERNAPDYRQEVDFVRSLPPVL